MNKFKSATDRKPVLVSDNGDDDNVYNDQARRNDNLITYKSTPIFFKYCDIHNDKLNASFAIPAQAVWLSCFL